MTYIVFKKLDIKETLKAMKGIEQFFLKYPKRKVCNTDLFEVRRGHLVEDILKHSSIG
jgi:hypothetical protein